MSGILILGKGIGFKKVTEYVEPRAEDTVYSMKECTERGEAEDIVNEVSLSLFRDCRCSFK